MGGTLSCFRNKLPCFPEKSMCSTGMLLGMLSLLGVAAFCIFAVKCKVSPPLWLVPVSLSGVALVCVLAVNKNDECMDKVLKLCLMLVGVGSVWCMPIMQLAHAGIPGHVFAMFA